MERKIELSEEFLSLTKGAQLLYLQFALQAEEGYVNAPKRVMHAVGCEVSDYDMLVARHFILPIENGVIVVRDWRLFKYLRSEDIIPEVVETVPPPDKRHRYGEYKRVYLSDSEYERLVEEYGQAFIDVCIKGLDEYIQQYGKKYKDFNLTLRRAIRDNWSFVPKYKERSTQQDGNTFKI